MAGHYIDTVENSVTGRPVNGAVIRVYTIPSASGGAFIPIYNDEALTDPIDQTDAPLTSNQYGRFEFYTNLSEGCIETSYGGIVRDVRENIAFIGGTVDGDVTALQIRVDNHDAVLGLSTNATDLGTFTGGTIADNTNVKAALQALETKAEAGAGTGPITTSGLTMATNRLIGRTTAGTGSPEEISVSGAAVLSGGTLAVAVATTAEAQAGTATNKLIDPATLFAMQAPQTLTDGATVTWDMALGPNAKVTLGGNRTLALTNMKAGVSYVLEVIQPASGGPCTLTMPASVNFGAAGTPTQSTAANKVDLYTFYCRDATTPKFRGVFNKDA